MYRRAPTLIAHQQLACEVLGFRWLSEQQRRALMQALRQELTRTFDRQQLLVFARRWLYDHHLIILHERSLRTTIASATRQYEAELAKRIHAAIDDTLLERWRKALVMPRESGLTHNKVGCGLRRPNTRRVRSKNCWNASRCSMNFAFNTT
jgi:hypothetical protein